MLLTREGEDVVEDGLLTFGQAVYIVYLEG